MFERGQQQQIEPDQRARRSCPPPRRAPCRAARPGRRGRPARSARPRRTTSRPIEASAASLAKLRIEIAERQHAEDRRAAHQQHARADLARAAPSPARRGARSRIGMTRSLETVIASATLSTTTMPVAAERPPIIVVSARPCAPALSGSASTVRSRSIAPSAKVARPAIASGATNRLIAPDRAETARRRGAMSRASRFSTIADMELARQQQDRRARTAASSTIQLAGSGGVRDHCGDARIVGADREERAEAAEHAPDDEGADREKGDELDHRFGRDRQDQPVLMLGRIDPPRAERHGEGGEQQRRRRERTATTARPASAGRARTSRPPSASSAVIALSCSAI